MGIIGKAMGFEVSLEMRCYCMFTILFTIPSKYRLAGWLIECYSVASSNKLFKHALPSSSRKRRGPHYMVIKFIDLMGPLWFVNALNIFQTWDHSHPTGHPFL